jgi:hypothetical protein
MKRWNVLTVLFDVCVIATTAHGQSTTPSQEELQRRLRLPPAAYEDLQPLILQLQQSQQQRQGGGGRGAPVLTRRVVNGGGAWWTDTALVTRLGLTDDQKAKIERAFENHRLDLVSKTEMLQKEEAQLARLLETETLDRNAVLTQIDRVIQARGELERTNAAMTLEMREALTRAQWMQLPPTDVLTADRNTRFYWNSTFSLRQPTTPGAAPPGQRTGGPRSGQRQQQ